MRNCLVIKTSSFGDIFQTLPAVLALKNNHPDLKITWAVEKRCMSALEGIKEIDELLVVDFKTWKKSPLKSLQDISTFVRSLKSSHYDLVLDFQANIKSAVILSLARAFEKRSFKKVAEWPHKLVRAKRFEADPSTSLKFNQHLIEDLVVSSKAYEPTIIDQYDVTIETHKKMIVMLGLGSNWSSKKLTHDEAKSLMRDLKNRFDPYFLIPSLGHEVLDHQRLLDGFEGEVLSLPKILNYTRYLKKTDLYVGVDSALLHLARLFNVKSIGYFGPSSAVFYGSFSDIQGSCPYGQTFIKRCSRLRSCSAPCMRDHFK